MHIPTGCGLNENWFEHFRPNEKGFGATAMKIE